MLRTPWRLDSFVRCSLFGKCLKCTMAAFKAVCLVVFWVVWNRRNRWRHATMEDKQKIKDEDHFSNVISLLALWISNRNSSINFDWGMVQGTFRCSLREGGSSSFGFVMSSLLCLKLRDNYVHFLFFL